MIGAFVRCDNCQSTRFWDKTKASDARHFARREGWQIGKRGEFCPSCRTTRKRDKQER